MQNEKSPLKAIANAACNYTPGWRKHNFLAMENEKEKVFFRSPMRITNAEKPLSEILFNETTLLDQQRMTCWNAWRPWPEQVNRYTSTLSNRCNLIRNILRSVRM